MLEFQLTDALLDKVISCLQDRLDDWVKYDDQTPFNMAISVLLEAILDDSEVFESIIEYRKFLELPESERDAVFEKALEEKNKTIFDRIRNSEEKIEAQFIARFCEVFKSEEFKQGILADGNNHLNFRIELEE